MAEAFQKKIPIIALCDTNTNPERMQYMIPGNDDAVKAIELVVKCIAQAYQEGKEEGRAAKVAEVAKIPEPATV